MAGTVGIIGLGIMGGAIAKNLLESAAGRSSANDLDTSKQAALTDAGGTACPDIARCSTPRSPGHPHQPPLAASAGLVAAAIAATPGPRIVIETSTMALADKIAARDVLSAAGHTALDCPLSGTGAQAANRDLVVYASGDTDAIAAQTSLFADFARAAHDIGAYGNGTRMKFVANLLVAIHNIAAAEAMVLCERRRSRSRFGRSTGRGRGGRLPHVRPCALQADDGGANLHAGDDAGIHLAEGHGNHRRLRPRSGCDTATVRGQRPDLPGSDAGEAWATRTPPRFSL